MQRLRRNIFDAAVGGGTTFPGWIWIFAGRGLRYASTLRTNELGVGRRPPLANWGSGRWPSTVASECRRGRLYSQMSRHFGSGSSRGSSIMSRYNLASDVVEGGPD